MRNARAVGLLVIADAKRGDIGSTARAYSTAFVESQDGREPVADAVTVNPYLGRDSLEPFVDVYRARLVKQLDDNRPFFFPFNRILCWGRRNRDSGFGIRD